MKKKLISIVGTSEIIHKHIKSLKKNNFKILCILSLSPRDTYQTKKILYFRKKYKIKKIFFNLKNFIEHASKYGSAILIAPKIEDNEKVLKETLKKKLKILIEKPVFLKPEQFNKYLKYHKNIFVGYNRIYYKNFYYIKKILKKNTPSNIVVNCPEYDKRSVITNSCHLISIIYKLFGKIYFLKKFSFKNHICAIFQTRKKQLVYFVLNLKNPENFSIKINFANMIVELDTIEKLFITKKIIKKKLQEENIYIPIKKLHIDELSKKEKPGFENQHINFRKFVENKKCTYVNIREAKYICQIANKINS
jgi:hypothetical protein